MRQLLNPKSGDIFYIPAIDKKGERGFVLSRYIDSIGKAGYLIEVFRKFYVKPPAKTKNITDSRLFRPILCSMAFRNIPRWKILFSDPDYDVGKSEFNRISISFDTEIWRAGKTLSATDIELSQNEPSICWRMDHLIFRVNSHLREEFGPDECYDYHRAKEKQDDPSAIANVLALANEIAENFELWSQALKKNPKFSDF